MEKIEVSSIDIICIAIIYALGAWKLFELLALFGKAFIRFIDRRDPLRHLQEKFDDERQT